MCCVMAMNDNKILKSNAAQSSHWSLHILMFFTFSILNTFDFFRQDKSIKVKNYYIYYPKL